jgi:hypothetical protein
MPRLRAFPRSPRNLHFEFVGEGAVEETEELERLERERAALLEEAARIVRAAETKKRTVTAEEDARVLALMGRARNLGERLGHLKRRHHQDGQDPAQNRGENK